MNKTRNNSNNKNTNCPNEPVKPAKAAPLSSPSPSPPPLASETGGCLWALTRKKPLDGRTETNLNRCLSLLDLTSLGVGSTLGLGLYVLAGQVASNKAGPAVVISFALAALASAFSALCYAEFAGRVPRAGSAYAYSYITVGEFVAFVIGWNLVLEYVIGASSVARGFSGYLRYVCQHLYEQFQGGTPPPISSITNLSRPLATTTNSSTHLLAHPINILATAVARTTNLTTTATTGSGSGSSWWLLAADGNNPVVDYVVRYFDWCSIVTVVVISAFILFGVKESTNVTLAFTATNLLVVVTVICSSLPALNWHNWRLDKAEVPRGFGEGGFLPYGWSGVLAGSATCFFGFIGFDTIASSAEEAQNPKRNVPLAIILSLFISFVAYVAVAIVQTLLWPYYDQNQVTILPYIFKQLHMPATYWIVLLGALAGLASSQLGGMYPLPRILYSMAQDRLIYGQLAHVNRRLKLPVRATLVGALFVALLACLLDIEDLADMVSIGTLAAYSLVSISVLIVRYETRSDSIDDDDDSPSAQPALAGDNLAQSVATGLAGQQAGELQLHDQQAVVVNGKQHLAANGKATENGHTMKKSAVNGGANGNDNHQAQVLAHEPETKPPIGINKFHSLDHHHHQLRPARAGKLLDLLIVWKAPRNKDANDEPNDFTAGQAKFLIASIVVLVICLNTLILLLTTLADLSTDYQNHHQRLQSDGQLQTWSLLTRLINKIVGASDAQPSDSDFAGPQLLLQTCTCIVLVALAAATLMLSRLPSSQPSSSEMFQVPLVPLTPTLSIMVNTFLMLNLSFLTWIRFAVWMFIGLFIYFTYGIWNSKGYLLAQIDK